MSKPSRPYNPAEMFTKVVITQQGCWEYRGSRTKANYGRIWVNGKHHYAHRLSWEYSNKTSAEDLCICHHCDNPPCINPAHLFLGTPKDNAIDKAKKGRAKNGNIKGMQHVLAKLSESDVMDILINADRKRSTKRRTTSQIELAKKYGVAKSLIGRIVRGESWPHVYHKFMNSISNTDNLPVAP